MTEQEKRDKQNELYIVNPISSESVINNIIALKSIRDINTLKSISRTLCEMGGNDSYLYSAVRRYCKKNEISLIARDEKKSIDDFLKEEVASKIPDGRTFVYITPEKSFDVLDSISKNMRESNLFVKLVRIYP